MQTENAQRPFLAVVTKTSPERGNEWALENQGTGPALNIRYRQGSDGWNSTVTPLGVEHYQTLRALDVKLGDLIISYESLGGTLYLTIVSWTNGEMRTRFATGIKSAPLPGEFRADG